MKTDAAAPAEATAKGAALAAGMRGVVRVGYRGPRVIRKTSRLEAVANCTVAALRRPEGAPDSPRTTAARSLYCIARCITNTSRETTGYDFKRAQMDYSVARRQ